MGTRTRSTHGGSRFVLTVARRPLVTPSPVCRLVNGGSVLNSCRAHEGRLTSLNVRFVLANRARMRSVSIVADSHKGALCSVTATTAMNCPTPVHAVILSPSMGVISAAASLVARAISFSLRNGALRRCLGCRLVNVMGSVVGTTKASVPALTSVTATVDVGGGLVCGVN